MKILITGAGGMLGMDLASHLSTKHEVLGVGRRPAPQLQIPFRIVNLADPDLVSKVFGEEKPQMVIHAAAMTEVDLCEKDRRQALRDNFEAARNVADASNRTDAFLILFGTDFVFDGRALNPYSEEDRPSPINVYGETKLLAEKYLALKAKRFLILRTAWLFGVHGDNFSKKILRQASTGKDFPVVSDQRGSPTYTRDLAEAAGELIDGVQQAGPRRENQIYHIANTGSVSRYEFAKAVLQKAHLALDLATPVSSETFQLPARRPKNSALSTEKLKAHFGIQLRPWQEALEAYLVEEMANLKR